MRNKLAEKGANLLHKHEVKDEGGEKQSMGGWQMKIKCRGRSRGIMTATGNEWTPFYFLIPLLPVYSDTHETADGAKSMYHISRSKRCDMEADIAHGQAEETLLLRLKK